jgi:hypothetical protein
MSIQSFLYLLLSLESQMTSGDSLQVFCKESEFSKILIVVNYTTSTLEYQYSSDVGDIDRAKFVKKPNGVLEIISSERGRLDKCRLKIKGKSGKMIIKTKRSSITLKSNGC